MCIACQNQKSPEMLSIPWNGYEGATHLVEAYYCQGGGIFATATDEFTAHRYAKIYKMLGFWNVKVSIHNEPNCKQIQERLLNTYPFS